jgi:hypothetical protein
LTTPTTVQRWAVIRIDDYGWNYLSGKPLQDLLDVENEMPMGNLLRTAASRAEAIFDGWREIEGLPPGG